MDRAEACDVLNFYRNRHYTEPLGTEERELADAINEILPHYAALREQEQSEQGCGWCDHFELDPQYLIGEGNGMYKELIFQFCPMCGRKLKEGAEG